MIKDELEYGRVVQWLSNAEHLLKYGTTIDINDDSVTMSISYFKTTINAIDIGLNYINKLKEE